jgi:hypothetical protein
MSVASMHIKLATTQSRQTDSTPKTEGIVRETVHNHSSVGHAFGRTAIFPQQRPLIQAKLKVNSPHDEYEREADAVAEKVMMKPVSGALHGLSPAPVIQRKCSKCEEEED